MAVVEYDRRWPAEFARLSAKAAVGRRGRVFHLLGTGREARDRAYAAAEVVE